MHIEIIPCLSDNYAYLIVNEDNKEAALVDAPEAAPIEARLKELDLKLSAVLITHHHYDHIDGLKEMNTDGVTIYGAKGDAHRLPALDVELEAGDQIDLWGTLVDIFQADGHTIGHIAYHAPKLGVLFSADSLMHWGCGRLFEGSPEQMWETLERFMKLPPATKVYSGHNYSVGNGKFALSLDGFMEAMEARFAKIEKQNAAGEPVVPASLEEELQSNPFLLAANDDYARALGIEAMLPVDRFAHIRKLKDAF